MTEINGEVSEGYEAVAEAFSNNFDEFEEKGAAFCLYVEGESVVDVWGGVADTVSGRPWESNTLQLHFSTTKGLAAVQRCSMKEENLTMRNLCLIIGQNSRREGKKK